MSDLNIRGRHNRNVTILDLAGKIRIGEDTTKLAMTLRVVVADGAKNILLNMADISDIDSNGLGELVAGYNFVQNSGGELKLLLTDRISELMVIPKLLTVFEVFDNEMEAVNSFQDASENFEMHASDFVTGKLDGTLLNHSSIKFG